MSGDHFFSSTQGLWASRHCARTVEHATTRSEIRHFAILIFVLPFDAFVFQN